MWRETLLAKCVLEGKTKGYIHHPQLYRFKQTDQPVDAIHHYLAVVYNEAFARGYHFDRNKIDWEFTPCKMIVTTGQIQYETEHLLNKLKKRDIVKFEELHQLYLFEPHPMFEMVDGGIEKWEII